jgi:hypothetical protein
MTRLLEFRHRCESASVPAKVRITAFCGPLAATDDVCGYTSNTQAAHVILANQLHTGTEPEFEDHPDEVSRDDRRGGAVIVRTIANPMGASS